MVVGLKKQVVIFVEGTGDSQVDSEAASQDGFIKINRNKKSRPVRNEKERIADMPDSLV